MDVGHVIVRELPLDGEQVAAHLALVSKTRNDAGDARVIAVWGSRKAGMTIRQEDLDSAIGNATATAGVVGGAIGAATGVFARRWFRWVPDMAASAFGAGIGALTGGAAGRQIALWSRREAARLVLEGNRIVIQDIGAASARFLELLGEGATEAGRRAFFTHLRPGSTEKEGQDRLAAAFRACLDAFVTSDPAAKREAMIAGNGEIVYHERCATRRLMTYEVGNRVLAVGDDLPGVSTPTAASDWTCIKERMRYVFALFRQFHNVPEIFAAPFPDLQMTRLEEISSKLPACR